MVGIKGILLAGGTGSRLYPLTKVTNKHLLPVGRYPMIYHPLLKLQQAGIKDILIITGKEHLGAIMNLLGSGNDFNLDITYKVQDQPLGIAHALGLAEAFTAGHSCVVVLGDNIFQANLAPFIQKYQQQVKGAMVMLKQVEYPERFGVAEIKEDRVISIIEKPLVPPSNYSVTGIYFYDAQVFTIIKQLQPSARGELEITDVNNAYIQMGLLNYAILPGYWTDAGTFSSLLLANQLTQDVIYEGLD